MMMREHEELESLRLRVAELERTLRRESAFMGTEGCFRAAFESSGVAQSIKLPTGEITITGAFREMLGYSDDDPPSFLWEELTAPEDIEYSRNMLDGLLNGKSDKVRYTKRYIHKNGSYVWGDVNLVLKRNEEGEPLFFIATVSDITAAKQTELKLQESEDRFRSIVENAPDAIFIQTEGKFAYLNPAACSLLGVSSQEELVGTPVVECVDPLFHDAVRGRIRRLNEERQPVRDAMEQRMVRADMSKIWVETCGEPFLYMGKMGALVFVRDITWRKEAEASLKESEERFRSIFEENLSVMFIVDPLTGRFLDANRACVAFYGWPREQLLRMRSQDVNMLGEKSLLEIQKAVAGEQSYFEFKHRLADGSVRDVEVFTSRIKASGEQILFCIVNDITSRKSAQRQVRLLGRAVEQNSGSIIITDATGTIEYVNPAFSLSTGYSADEVIGRHVRMLRLEDHGELFHEEVWAALLSGRTWRGEVRSRKKSGELCWENVLISPIHDEGSAISHLIAIKDDITEKKQLIGSLVRAKERAEESDRLKTAFLQNMSHEIRTPMNGILGFLGLLDEPALDESERSEYIQIVNISGQRLMRTIDEILEISRIESGEVSLRTEKVDVEQMMRYLRDFYSLEAQKKGIVLTLAGHLCGGDAMISTDKNKLYSSLSTLMGNAVKFTRKGYVEFGNRIEGANLVFYVKDTGIGIPAHLLGVVFERFMQVDQGDTRPYEGCGLGLAISKAYVEALGGTIHVVSEEGKGSVFSFSIPYAVVS